MDANEDYLDSLLNAVMSQDSGSGDGGLGGTQQNNGSEAELEEINDLLKKSDQNQMPDADMLAMLEKAESEAAEGVSDNDIPDVFDIFSSESLDAEENGIAETSGPDMGMSGEVLPARQADGSDGEAYLDALLNGTGADDGAAVSEEQPPVEDYAEGDDLLSLDSLQSEEEQPPVEDYAGGDDLLSLDSLQSEEEQPPVEDYAGGDDLLSLDSLQSEEEQPPVEDYAGGDDLLSLDSLQSEEEQPPVEDDAGGDDLLSLDSLQSEEEQPPVEDDAGGDDLLSLDSLQSDELMSYAESEEDDGKSAEEDEAIQREIDELLGLAGVSDDEASGSGHDDNAADLTLSAAVPEEEDASGSKKKKVKKEKKKRFGKKTKEAADTSEGGDGGLDGGETGEDSAFDGMSDDLAADLPLSAGESGAADTKKPKTKGKKQKAEKQKKEPGVFSKFLNTLFEETEEEEEDQLQEMEVSDENREVIATVENEKIENKKSGSKKGKKGKKGKAGAKQEADGEEDEEAPVDEKKAAKEKKKREKKEKKEQKEKARKEKEEEEKAIPKKKLPRGKVFSIFAVCLTLLAVIVILCFVLPQQQDLKKAREAYYEQDYLTVYQNMDGKDLSDSDYILYMRSRMILNMQGKLDNYLVYMGMDKEMAALNELMLAVHYYQTNRALAEGYGALAEMDTIYAQILSVLEQQYQVSEQEAIEIFALDDLSYNERLYYLVHGTEFVAPGVSQIGMQGGADNMTGADDAGSTDSDMPDILPEENEMTGDSQFQENAGTGGDLSNPTIDPNANAGAPENGGSAGNGAENAAPEMPDAADGYVPEQGMPDSSDGNVPDQGMQGDAGGNVPGESLSQGDGEVLYSGEVQNGNVVLQ